MENIHQAAFLVCLVLAIFAGVGIRQASNLDRRDAQEAQENNQSEGTP